MKIIDYLSEKDQKRVDEEELNIYQGILDENLKPGFIDKIQNYINKTISGTGSCLLLPKHNTGPLCRYGLELICEQDVRDLIFSPAFNIIATQPNPGDLVGFCIVANSPAAAMFAWDIFMDNWRTESLPKTLDLDYEDVWTFEKYLRKQLREIREYERKQSGKRKK